MSVKQDTFSLGYGALLRRFSALKNGFIIMVICTIICAVLMGFIAYRFALNDADRQVGMWHMEALFRQLAPPATHARQMSIDLQGQSNYVSADDVLTFGPFNDAWERAESRSLAGALVGAIIGGVLSIFLLLRINAKGGTMAGEKHLRGNHFLTEVEMAKACNDVAVGNGDLGPLARIGSVPIPRRLETQNFLVAGAVGAGKTTAIRQLMETAEERGECVIVYDPHGVLASAYYKPERGDVILNPYDARAATWDLFDEIRMPSDARTVAQSIVQVPPGEKDDGGWLKATRGFVADVIWTLKSTGRGNVEELLRVLGFAEKGALAKLVDGTSSRRLFEEGAERATASVLFGLPTVLHVLATLRRSPGVGGSFSWTRWAQELDGKAGAKPWLFLGAPARQAAAVGPLISTWFDLAGTNILSLPADHPTRRVWMVLDEFANLPPMKVIPDLSSQGRKFGAVLILGIQNPSQVQDTYGEKPSETLMGNCGTQLYLRLGAGYPAKWAVAKLGDHEIELRQENDQYDTEEAHGRSSMSVSRKDGFVLLESEVSGLKERHGFLCLPSVSVGRVVIPLAHVENRPRGVGIQPVDWAELWESELPRTKPASLVELDTYDRPPPDIEAGESSAVGDDREFYL